MSPSLRLSIAMLCAGMLLGCDDRDAARVYRAPKDQPANATDAMGAPTDASRPIAPAVVASAGEPQWVVPAGWVRLPDQAMRFATFQVDKDDPTLTCEVYTFGPESGQLLANVNRWEKQIGAPISAEADLPKVVTHTASNSLQIDTVDIEGPAPAGQTEPVRLLASIIPAPTQVWFLKFAGPKSKIAQHKAEYDAFLASFSLGGTSSAPAVSNAGSGIKQWKIPDGWVQDTTPHTMRIATFHVKAGSDQAEIIITMLQTNAYGTPEANITRWRGQVGLAPLADISTVLQTKIKIGDSDGVLMDFVGTDQPPQRLLVAQAVRGTNTWFFKILGPADLVTDQKSALISFLDSLEFDSSPQ